MLRLGKEVSAIKIFLSHFRDFPRKDHAAPLPPPQNVTKLFAGLLQPTFQKGTGSFVSGGPYGPEGEPPPPSKCDKTLYTGL